MQLAFQVTWFSLPASSIAGLPAGKLLTPAEPILWAPQPSPLRALISHLLSPAAAQPYPGGAASSGREEGGPSVTRVFHGTGVGKSGCTSCRVRLSPPVPHWIL